MWSRFIMYGILVLLLVKPLLINKWNILLTFRVQRMMIQLRLRPSLLTRTTCLLLNSLSYSRRFCYHLTWLLYLRKWKLFHINRIIVCTLTHCLQFLNIFKNSFLIDLGYHICWYIHFTPINLLLHVIDLSKFLCLFTITLILDSFCEHFTLRILSNDRLLIILWVLLI